MRSSRSAGQWVSRGALPLRRVKGQRPLWGLGQRPNCSSSNLFKGRSQAKSRQRSVPRPNFARPQTRPQAALFNVYAVSRRWRDRTACLSDMAACFRKQGFRACGRESGALRSPPTPLRSAHPCSLTVIVSRENRNCPPSAPQSAPHADAPDLQTAPPAPGTAARRPSAPQTG